MRNLKFLMIGLLFVGLAGLTSCKKENQIEKNLWNKGGEWNITTWKESGSDNGEVYLEVIKDAGTFKFEKDGNGKITFVLDNDVVPFTYTNTENSLTTILGGEFTIIWTLEWEKNKITLDHYESHDEGFDELTVTLEKK